MQLLEDEMSSFQKQNKMLKELEKKMEKEHETRMFELESKHQKSLSLIEDEWKKINKEKKGMIERTKESAIHRKLTRNDVEDSKQQLEQLHKDLKEEKAKSKTSIDRLKSRVDVLTKNNSELESQVKNLEEKVLKYYWKENSKGSSQKKQEDKTNNGLLYETERMQENFEKNEEFMSMVDDGVENEGNQGETRLLDEDNAEVGNKSFEEIPMVNSFELATKIYGSSSNKPRHYRIKSSPNRGSSKDALPETQTIVFKNGTRKRLDSNGKTTVTFPNGDIKETLPDGHMIYWYKSADPITHVVTQPDSIQLVHFKNGSVEILNPTKIS
eukprot:TRINITY_DN5677_c0_g1_i4.p1 TRINITY_DN5677_c0_g1~~TRINITY_DN5677_c0_g1_i4.p1  ORF type:complete len:327 (-),score=79.33 TRINITY_DN5677_c0_g1_i4:250-1230(-)